MMFFCIPQVKEQCDECGACFSDIYHLRNHKRVKHGAEKLKCHKCDFTTPSSIQLKKHKIAKHQICGAPGHEKPKETMRY